MSAPDAEPEPAAPDGPELEPGGSDALVDELIAPLYETRFLQTDARGQITGWNPAAEETFGWPRQSVLGQAFTETLIPPESRDEFKSGFDSFLATGEHPIFGRVRLRHRDGHVLPVALAIVPIPLKLGYEFNQLLKGLTAPLASGGQMERLNHEHADVFASIRESLREGLAGGEREDRSWRDSSMVFDIPTLPSEEAAEAEDEEEQPAKLGGALAIYRLLGDGVGAAAADEDAEDAEEAEGEPAPPRKRAKAAPAADGEVAVLVARLAAAEAQRDEAIARAGALEVKLEDARAEAQETLRRLADAETAMEEAERSEREAREELARLRSDSPSPPAGVQPDEPVARAASQMGFKQITVPPEQIEQALAEDGFVVYGQPVISLETSEVHHVELLLRMEDAKGRLVLPDAFLDSARRAGLMLQVDYWVIRHALRLMSERPDVRLAVNLSAEAVADPELPRVLEQEITDLGLDPGRLILDVSERYAVNQMDAANRLQKRTRALGCGFALDDFGSTFGSFRCLKQMRIDYLKLDADLIDTITESRTDQLVVKALVEVAAGLDVETVAEHVSDEVTLEHLRGVGVGLAQGYALGRPRLVSDLLDDEQSSAPGVQE